MGNRRFVVGVGIFAALAATLSGCASSDVGLDASAASIGQQAIGFTSAGSADGSTGWSSSLGCPDSLKQGFTATLPTGSTFVSLDVASTSGVAADPGITTGDIPNCAFRISTAQVTLTALVFLNMGQSYQEAIRAKLQTDGFVGGAPQAIEHGTEQEFDKGGLVLELATISADGLTAFAVMG